MASASTSSEILNVNVTEATQVECARKKLMSVYPIHVRMVDRVLIMSMGTNANVQGGQLEGTVNMTTLSVTVTHVSTGPIVSTK